MTIRELIRKAQEAMNSSGSKLSVDGQYGPKTERESGKYEFEIIAKLKPQPDPETQDQKEKPIPIWLEEAKKYEGKKETDPEFNKFMSSKWKLVGLNLGTIAKSWAAWCGLAIAVSLAGAGLSWQKNGAGARHWAEYGVAIDWKEDGLPRGAIIHINNSQDCSSKSNNHVTLANGDCAPEDLKGHFATFDGYGGNQGNRWKVSTYAAKKICAVRWPAEVEKPAKVTKSVNCTGQKADDESTR